MEISRRAPFYGIWIVAASWVVYFAACGPNAYGVGVLVTKIVSEHQWSESLIGMASSVNFAFVAIGSIPGSIINKKFGYRIGMILGTGLGAMSYLVLLLFSGNSPVILVSMFVGTGLCTAFASMTSCVGIVNEWYDRNKAMPLSVLLTAGSAAGFIMPMVIQAVSSISIGACWTLFVLMSLAGLMIAVIVVRDRPSDLGEVQDGRAWVKKHPPTDSDKAVNMFSGNLPVRACFRSCTLYSLMVQLFGSRAIYAAFNSYIVLYAIRSGVDAVYAALLLTIFNIFNLIGRFLTGVLIKLQMPEKMLNILSFILKFIGCFLMVWNQSFLSLAVSCALVGSGFGLLCSLLPLLISRCFTDDNFSILNGMFNTVGSMGAAAAPMLLFTLAETLGGYRNAYIVFAAGIMVCLLFALLTPVRCMNRHC